MSRLCFSYRKLAVLGAVLTITLTQSLGISRVTSQPNGGVASDPDLIAEAKILTTYVTDLKSFDRKCALLGKKDGITSDEFAGAQRNGDDLKRRLPDVQNALRETIRKLKAAGVWDDLDAIVLARVKDPKFQAIARQQSFKATLESSASNLGNAGTEIVSPLDVLRKKIAARAQDPGLDQNSSESAFRFVRASFSPAPLRFEGLKCRISWLRTGINNAFRTGEARETNADQLNTAIGCYCNGDKLDCESL
jgi:hypothetical protein